MSVELRSTKARVRNPEEVREILDSYDVESVEIELSDGSDAWTFAMTFEDGYYDSTGFPQALHRDHWPDEERYPDEDDWDADSLKESEWDRRYAELGRAGFQALLLETPLLILVAGGMPNYRMAEAWLVQPGAKEVAMLDISL